MTGAFGHALVAVLAFLLLNLLLTGRNVPKSFWLAPQARLSLELVLLVAALAFFRPRRPPWLLRSLAAAMLLAALARAVDVTTPGVLGRPLDLYGDLPHLQNVVGMAQSGISSTRAAAIAAGAVVALIAGYALVLWCLAAIERALDVPSIRTSILVCCLLLLALAPWSLRPRPHQPPPGFDPWVGHVESAATPPPAPPYAEPLAALAARHVRAFRAAPRTLALPRRRHGETAPAIAALGDPGTGELAHVLLIFVESYGVTALDDPQHRPAIAAHWRALERRLQGGGVAAVSRRLRSPTMGGGSWRAHATLLSGLRIDNQRLYELLLGSNHPSLPHLLRGAGYRTVAVEPGIRGAWADAERLGFDQLYDAGRLDYRGPTIGWWHIPDQYTLLRLHQAELRHPLPPVFAKVSLIMSHFPYTPIPGIVDWQRLRAGTAYEHALPSVAAEDYRDQAELSARYVVAMRHELDAITGFVLELVPGNTLVLVAGDHQPPKLATHDSSSWAVPLHILSRRHDLVARFAAQGFTPGLLPPPTPPPLPMERVLDLFFAALGGAPPSGHDPSSAG